MRDYEVRTLRMQQHRERERESESEREKKKCVCVCVCGRCVKKKSNKCFANDTVDNK